MPSRRSGRAFARRSSLAASLAAALLATGSANAQLVRSGSGATSADAALLAAIAAFQADLGTLNGNLPVSFAGGRREINWDAVPQAASSPNAFPGNFFNGNVAGRARGALFSTPGAGFEVSANAGEGPTQFSNINATYPGLFEPFSPQKIFTAIGSNIVDVEFRLPSDQTTIAMTRGFGVVFSDVDLANVTSVEFFDFVGNSLGTFGAPAIAGNETFSFVGASFTDAIVRRVRITNGNSALGGDEVGGTDLVVMDDFIYGEPVNAAAVVPEPTTVTLVAGGLAALVAAARRRRTASA
jgi:hypothetical protein